MILTDTKEMYERSRTSDYAIGGFIAYNMEMFQALVAAANRTRSPLLMQSSAQAVDYAGGEYLVALARTAAEQAEVPVAHHLDHGFTVGVCKRAVDLGFTSVMIDASDHPFEENIRMTREVVEYAHERGVVVEGELGSPELGGAHTDPDQAAEFVARTGVDSLAVVVGNIHGQMTHHAPPVIDVERLREIHRTIPEVPLVLHALTIVPEPEREAFLAAGGEIGPTYTVSDELYREIAGLEGVAKLNNGASLKMAAVTAMRQALDANRSNIDPRKVWAAARTALEDIIAGHMARLGCTGRA